MSVEYVTYKRKKLPVKVGYYALKRMQKAHGVSMDAIQGDLSLYEPLLFYSLERGHKIEGKEFNFKLEDMEDVLEECFFEFVTILPSFFPDAKDLEKKMGRGVGTK